MKHVTSVPLIEEQVIAKHRDQIGQILHNGNHWHTQIDIRHEASVQHANKHDVDG